MAVTQQVHAKPFLKWAGGKTQLLSTFAKYYPKALAEGRIQRYVEPFMGSGAVLFQVVQNYPVREAVIMDINPDLVLAYQVVQQNVDGLIDVLSRLQQDYLDCPAEARKAYYYQIRSEFNQTSPGKATSAQDPASVQRVAQLIFLNKTCFNGLYRVNRSGHFNVPAGDYEKPTICDAENLRAVHMCLQNVTVLHGDYQNSLDYVNRDTFVYFDPPYRPISRTSSFTSYSKDAFTDQDQCRLADYFRALDHRGAALMLSNSDPKNVRPDDNFFEQLYDGFHIYRERARRVINSKGDARGQINELIITNYAV